MYVTEHQREYWESHGGGSQQGPKSYSLPSMGLAQHGLRQGSHPMQAFEQFYRPDSGLPVHTTTQPQHSWVSPTPFAYAPHMPAGYGSPGYQLAEMTNASVGYHQNLGPRPMPISAPAPAAAPPPVPALVPATAVVSASMAGAHTIPMGISPDVSRLSRNSLESPVVAHQQNVRRTEPMPVGYPRHLLYHPYPC